jgi:hypothetical protein
MSEVTSSTWLVARLNDAKKIPVSRIILINRFVFIMG